MYGEGDSVARQRGSHPIKYDEGRGWLLPIFFNQSKDSSETSTFDLGKKKVRSNLRLECGN